MHAQFALLNMLIKSLFGDGGSLFFISIFEFIYLFSGSIFIEI